MSDYTQYGIAAAARIAELEADLDVLDVKYVTVQHELAALKDAVETLLGESSTTWSDKALRAVVAIDKLLAERDSE